MNQMVSMDDVETDVMVEDGGTAYRVTAPFDTDATITSVTVTTDDGCTYIYDDRCGTYSRSRVLPNVLEFATREKIVE